jgi:methylenetetrahydrofolate--tRNA-(uracil-5-)-methyltransferase
MTGAPRPSRARVVIVGAGLAGCEAALGLAERNFEVDLIEQKPKERTPAQSSDHFSELVCSNSFRGAALSNAVGLLKEEMRRLGSFVLRAADAHRIPAGGALAVDRDGFSAQVTEWVRAHPRIRVVCEAVSRIVDARPVIIATGPLTGDRLAADIAARVGRESLAYYDDQDAVFFASRYDKGQDEEDRQAYVNCPLDEATYRRFVDEVKKAKKVEPKSFEDVRYFEGCLPIEVMAERGEDTLRFGPMKPVGLVDPRTGRRPYAVVQLRREDAAGTAYNIVGFQSRMTWSEQARIFRMIPGLANAEFHRYGAVHRNTFLNAPKLLDGALQLKSEPGVYFAGQITGTEGYVESAAGGWLAAYIVAERLEGREPILPPATTAHGGLLTHMSRNADDYQPSNITFSHLPPWDGPRLGKRARHEAIAGRALADLEAWKRQMETLAGASARVA